MHLAPKYSEKELPTRFRDQAFAYLESSERLCQQMADGTWESNFHRGQAVLWLAFHATELLLKACIYSAAPGQLKNVHPLGELLKVFSTYFPALPFEPSFGPEPVPADPELIEWTREVDRTLHERLRYPTNKAGVPWPGEHAFMPELFLAELERLHSDFQRISLTVFGK